MSDQFPEEWVVVVERTSDTHDALCDTVIDDYGYTFVNDRLYEIVTWVPCGESSWRWTLKRCDDVPSA
jgi:hypothetical protein